MHNNGQWTDARYKGFITSALRQASRRWPPKYLALKDAYTSTKINRKSGRKARHFACACCKGSFPAKEVQVDHIEPIGKDLDWNTFIERLFCEKENLQVLCKPCHKEKTKRENNPT